MAAPAAPLLGEPEPGPAAFDPERPRFAIAVLPDTQYLFDADSAEPTPVRAALAHLLGRRDVAFLAGLGDITEHGTEQEIALAGDVFRAVDGRLPYSVVAGNHDVDAATDDQRGPSPYLRTFGPARFRSRAGYEASPDGHNSAHLFRAGGRYWLNLALDWRVSASGLAWARDVLRRHATVPAFLTTHDLAYADDRGGALLSPNGQRLWDGLIRDHDQIFLTLNGHDWPSGRTVLTNAAGRDVHLHLANYQDRYYGGAGLIRLYHVDLTRGRIDVETFSPWLLAIDEATRTPLEAGTAALTGDEDRFSVAIGFAARFAGFDPPVLPASRPAAAVIGPDTVAYWRFDEPGQAVHEGATARDQTGNGNDLAVRLLPGSAPETLALSPDHHVGAPGHASLRFDGGSGPDRGATLRTGPGAPLNSMRFLDGYTIELFVKLPEPFVGDHAFMGIFSFEGRSGDAGKRSGWTTLEPTCSLNLSSERFLQHVLYPAEGDHNPTAWSHALPVGRWLHLALVNDGRRSMLWVDGSRTARNPAVDSRGIATVGRPFVLGATSFDLRYGQGFYGWIGDVRITGRALPPGDFLPAKRFD